MKRMRLIAVASTASAIKLHKVQKSGMRGNREEGVLAKIQLPGAYCKENTSFGRQGPCEMVGTDGMDPNLSNSAATVSLQQCEAACIGTADCNAFSLDNRAYFEDGDVKDATAACCSLFVGCTWDSTSDATAWQMGASFYKMLGTRLPAVSLTATQSSDAGGAVASKPLTALPVTDFANTANTCAETNDDGTQWWRVSMGSSPKMVKRFVLYNRGEAASQPALSSNSEFILLKGTDADGSPIEEKLPHGEISADGTDVILTPARQATGLEIRSKLPGTAMGLCGVFVDVVNVDAVADEGKGVVASLAQQIQNQQVTNLSQQVETAMRSITSKTADLLGR
eukprot:CAMPEP_0178989968 /NCGR_PEP_ID=MMETSP0795-20121207/4670_1 /TAXON_ID=88552 /ORGANISM="Amoebophrya sp., Strain Ameob2" /LENGTH=338 /DNA_ID=CAMNT_0020681431 /DNA_START=208 /DNA_END=1224 /DNA_ORIENTATION=-